MEFGVFHLMCARGADARPSELIRETVEETRIADELGYSAAWFAEHHFSRYGLCASPLMLVAHCSPITRQIRLATGVLVLPLYNPMRLLSEIILADNLSNGRVTVGVGAGYQPAEFDRFGVAIEDRFSMMNEFLDIMDLAFSKPNFAYKGKYYHVPETDFPVRPLQAHVPIYVAGHSEDMFRLAARRKCRVLTSGTVCDADYLADQYGALQRAFVAESADLERTPIAVNRFCHVTTDRQEGLRFAENARYQSRLGRRRSSGGAPPDPETPFANEPSLESIHDNLLIGDVETVAEKLAREVGVSHASHFCFSFKVGAICRRAAIRSMELMMTEVKPRVERSLRPS